MDLLDQMRTFTKIVDTGRLRAAAKSRKLSIAAVSRQLSALEDELGTTLLIRSSHKLALTESGRRWYESCNKLLADLETARRDLEEPGDVRGSVVVSAPVSYGLGHLITRFEKLTRLHPRLTLELRLEDTAVDLIGSGVDIAVRVGMTLPDSNSVIAHELVTFHRSAVASASYLRKRGTPKHPRDLADHDLLVHLRAAPSFTRWRFVHEASGTTHEVDPRPRLASSSPLALRAWAEQGAGIALIPAWLTADLTPVLKGWTTPPVTAYALHRSDVRAAERIRVVVEALREGMTG